MITALTIKHEQPNSLKERFRALFSPYEINVKRINDDYLGLEMIHITYVQKSGRIRFGKIKRSVNADFHETVCSSSLSLPRKLGFKRFDNPMYIRRLCINAAESYITEHGFDPMYGARPLKRYVQKTVETLAAKLILKGDINTGDDIVIDVVNGELTARAEGRKAIEEK